MNRLARVVCLSGLAALMLLFSSCSVKNIHPPTSTPGEEASPTPTSVSPPAPTSRDEVPQPLIVEENHWEETYKADDGFVVMTARCTLPSFSSDAPETMRTLYEEDMQSFQSTAAGAAEGARQHYNSSQTDASFFSPYTMEQNFMVSFNEKGYFSVVRELFSYEGGAHDLAWKSAETFDLTTSARIGLDDLFLVGPDVYLPWLTAYVCGLIEPDAQNYNTNYVEQVTQYIRDVDFALTPEGLTLFFRPYLIAPYTAGAPSFDIPLEDMKDIWRAY